MFSQRMILFVNFWGGGLRRVFVGAHGLSLVATSWAAHIAVHRLLMQRRAWALGHSGSRVVWHGLGCSEHVRSSRTSDRTCVPCIDRRILTHWTTQDVPVKFL